MSSIQIITTIPAPEMVSPTKKPLTTYSRKSSNLLPMTAAAALDPDAMLQEKIRSVLGGAEKENSKKRFAEEAEEEFDSAYIETNNNAKNVHDLLQVGEKTRFVDELEYLLEELKVEGKPNFPIICAALDDLIGKSCRSANSHSNSFFGLQLKSHGVLLQIFESLSPAGELVDSDEVHLRLLVLVALLLPDVRRLDFFVPAGCALKLARFCFKERGREDGENWTLLKGSPIFSLLDLKQNHAAFLGIWILTKMTLASLNSPAEERFCDLLAGDEAFCQTLFGCLCAPFELVVRERAAALLDAVFTFTTLELPVQEESFHRLVADAIENNSAPFFKLAVTLSGSSDGALLLSRCSPAEWMPTLRLLLSPSEEESLAPLKHSCFVNFIDRVPEGILDELRVQNEDSKRSILGELASLFASGPSLLLALAITFAAYQNKTNAAVIKAAWAEKAPELCVQLRKFINNFLSEQRAQKKRVRVRNVEQEERVLERLELSLTMY